MKLRWLLGAALAMLITAGAATDGTAQDLVLNKGFQTEDWMRWTTFGNIPDRGVLSFNTSGSGYSWSYYQIPYTGFGGGLSQTIYVLEGVTYEVSADVAYYSC